MVARKLDELGADPVAGGAPRPFGTKHLIVAANHVCCLHIREFGQRARLERRIYRLGPEAVESGLLGWLVTLAVEHRAGDVEVGPHLPQPLIGHAQPLFVHRVEHLELIAQLIEEAAADVGDHGAEVNQMSDGSTGGHQRDRISTVGVSDEHDIVAASI